MANYAVYPFKNMRITQNYSGTVSHLPNSAGSPKDYPIDEAGKDTGKEACYPPCDEIVVKRVYGVGNRGTNTVFFESTDKVKFADGTEDYLCGLCIHTSDSDLKKLKVGQKIKRNQVFLKEGTDGGGGKTVGLHLHMSFGKGKLTGNGWKQNTYKGKAGNYVLTCTGGTFKPEKLLFVDPDFTKVIDKKGLAFKTLQKYTTGKYKVNASLLNVRSGAGTNYAKKKFSQLTANAQAQIKKLNKNKPADGLVKGVVCTVSEIKNNWGKIPSGWICLDYCVKN